MDSKTFTGGNDNSLEENKSLSKKSSFQTGKLLKYGNLFLNLIKLLIIKKFK